MNCPKCGKKLTEAICGSCGYDISSQGFIFVFPLTGPTQLKLKELCSRSLNFSDIRGGQSLKKRKNSMVSSILEVRTNNVLMSDMPDNSNDNESRVFGSQYTRNQINTVTFLDTLASLPRDAWDVSEAQDGSVMAWVKPHGKRFDLNIGAKGGVAAPRDCSCLFAGYEHVRAINFNGIFNTANVTDMFAMFDGCEALKFLKVSGFDTANVTDMSCMFGGCEALESLDVSDFDTANVTNMSCIFCGCSSLTVLDVSGFGTANVTDMSNMFHGCSSLTALDVSGFDTAEVTNMSSMFYGCRSLTVLDVSGFDTANVTDMSCMFCVCEALELLDVRGFDIAKVKNMCRMFSLCKKLTALHVRNWNTYHIDTEDMFKFCALKRSKVVSAILSGETVST